MPITSLSPSAGNAHLADFRASHPNPRLTMKELKEFLQQASKSYRSGAVSQDLDLEPVHFTADKCPVGVYKDTSKPPSCWLIRRNVKFTVTPPSLPRVPTFFEEEHKIEERYWKIEWASKTKSRRTEWLKPAIMHVEDGI